MSDINVSMNIDDVVAKTAQFLKLNAQQQQALQNLIATTTNLNAAGKASSAYFEAQINTNQKLVTSITGIGTENENVSRKIVATTTAIQRQRDAVQALISEQNRARVGKVAGVDSGNYNAQELARIEKIRTAIGRLDAETVKPKNITDFFSSIKAGNIPEATGALAKLRDELVKLNNVRDASKARQAKEATSGNVGGLSDAELQRRAAVRARNFSDSFSGLTVKPIADNLGIDTSKLTLQQEAQIRKIGSNISRIIRNSVSEDSDKIVDNKSVRGLIPDLLKGQKLDFINKPELQAASDQISKLISLFERLKNAQAAAAAAKGPKVVDPAALKAQADAQARALEFRKNFQNNIADAASSQFNIPTSDLSIRQKGVLRNASAAIGKQIQSSTSGLDQGKVQDLFNQLRNGAAANVVAPAGSELSKTASELTKIIGLYERLRQEKDRESRGNQNRSDQSLRSQRAAEEAEVRVQSIQNRVGRTVRPLQSQLGAIHPNLQIDDNALQNITRRIGELGQKSQLSQRQVLELYSRFQSGSLTQADSQFTRLIALFQKLADLANKAKVSANNYAARNPGSNSGGPSKPFSDAAGGELPPRKGDIENAKAYSGIYDKIKGTLEYFLVYKGFNLLTNQLQSAFDNARKFQVQVSLIRTISQDSQQSVQATAAALVRVSNKTGLDLSDVANSAYDAVSNQVTRGAQTEKFIESAGNLAKTTNSNLQDSVNLLSGAINSYGLDVNDAEQISAKFFKAIDIGKIKASELANTFGRVAFVGRDLGVSFDEILGILATLTQKGVTTDDAVTLLTNGMTKLTNPTEKVSALLKTIGFDSGPAAVKVKGFTETMKFLTQAVEDGKIALSDLFPEIRSEKFGSAFKTFSSDIVKNTKTIGKDSGPTYEAAKDIRNESAGQKITEEINQLKNTLSQTFGNELTTLLKGLIDASGGVDKLAESVTALGRVVLIGGVAFLTYKGAILAAQTATGILNGVITIGTGVANARTLAAARLTGTTAAATAVTNTNTAATNVNTAAVRQSRAAYLAHPIGLLIAGGAALYAYYETQNIEIGKVDEKLQTLNDTYKDFINTQKKVTQENVFKTYADDLDKAQNKIREAGARIASALAGANANLEASKTKSKDTADALKEGFGRYINFVKDRISDISREYNKFDDRIKSSSKAILSFREQAREQLFGAKEKYAGDFDFDGYRQKFQLIAQERTRLQSQITQLYTKGSDEKVGVTDEDLQRARELGGQLIKLRGQENDLRQDKANKDLDRDLKQNPDRYRPDANGKVYRGVDLNPLQAGQNADLKFLEAFEKSTQAREIAKHAADEKALLDKKDALAKAEAAIKAFDDIKLFDKGGSVTTEFRDKVSGQVDFPKVKEALNKAAVKAKNSLDPTALKALGPEIDTLLAKRLLALNNEVTAAEAVDKLRQSQNQVSETLKKTSGDYENARKDIQKYGGDVETLTKQLDALARGLEQIGGSQALEGVIRQGITTKNGIGGANPNQVERTINRFPSVDDAGRLLGLNKTPSAKEQASAQVQGIKDQAKAIASTLNDLRTQLADKTGLKPVTPEQITNVVGSIEQLKAKVKAALKENLGTDQVALPGIPSIPELDKLSEGLAESLKAAGANYNKSINTLDQLRTSSNQLSTDLGTTLQQLKDIGPAATAGLGGAATPFITLNTQVDALNAKLDLTIRKFGQITGATIPAKPADAINPDAVPKDAFDQPKAFGGMIDHYASGGAVGSDNRQVYAQAGEYIWNRNTTSKYYSQIQALNRQGRTPVSFNQTSGDTIHVGGVTINESKSGQATASDLLGMIRRQQRRG